MKTGLDTHIKLKKKYYDRGELRTACVVILGLPMSLRLSKGANLGLLESYVASWK